MMLELVENDLYYFDEEAADRPCRFIEKYLKHFEGKFADQPFLLHPIQRKMIRDVHGWKCRDTGYRRFTDWHFEAGIGAGKSPLMAALGLYHLCADGEQGGQIYCLASTFSQAKVVFDTAKRFIEASRELSKILQITQYEIRHPKSKSFWKIVSGKGPKAGLRPSMVLMDEVQEAPSREVYDSLQGRMSKRRQPLFIGALNAGKSQVSLAWQLHQKAELAASGKGDPNLYPVIWAAPEGAQLNDPAAWRAANQLLGVTIAESKIRDELAKCSDAAEEAEFARKYLSRWPKSNGTRWLEMNLWDAAQREFNPKTFNPKDTAIYQGIDLALGNDLCAAVTCWVTPERMYVDSHFWMTRENAERYEAKKSIPYSDWAKGGYITIVDSPTIGAVEKKAIADHLTSRATGFKLKAVCYDAFAADDCIAHLEALSIPCVPIRQGYSLSPGCFELERRLKEGGITIAPSPVLRFCAENTEVKGDERGNIWPIKPNAGGRYAGRRHLKIDGISALCSLLVEARKFSFPKKQSNAKAVLI